MKKIFAFAIAAVTMTVGCQKIQELVNPDKNQPSFDDNEPVEITFNTNVVNVETKANGSVTAFDPAEHTLYVYGLNTSTPGTKEVTNVAATATGGTSPVNLTLTGTYFYNGTDDKYDFYGYYVDDAADPKNVATDYTLPVVINGTQDILLAKADKANDVIGKNVDENDAYSAKTARAGVTPNLQFKHQMSQFSFHVRNCGTYAITLKGLSLNTINKGTLTVAGDSQGLVALTGDDNKEDLEVSATETNLPIVDKTQTENYTKVGEPIMVFSENTYTAILYLWQTGMAETTVRKVTVPVTITNDQDDLTEAGIEGNDPGALKGYGYEINITVYSLEQISVTASLVGWKEGKTFAFDTEDNEIDGEDDVDWPVSGEDDEEQQEPTTSVFAVTPGTLEIEATATSFAVTVTLDGEAPTSEDGITVDAGTLSYNFETGTYTFTVPANETTEAVNYSVKFTYGETEREVTVTQKAATNDQLQQ